MNVFYVSLIIIIVVSFLWALFSLRKELRKPKEIKKAAEELKREKILFKK